MYHLVNEVYIDTNDSGGSSTTLTVISIDCFREWLLGCMATPMRNVVRLDARDYLILYSIQVLSIYPDMTFTEFREILMTVRTKISINQVLSGQYPDNTKDFFSHDSLLDMFSNYREYSGIMRSVCYSNLNTWPFEWRVWDCIKSDIPADTLIIEAIDLQYRNLTALGIEALREIQHLVGDRRNWDALGCDLDTLMGGDTIIDGILGLPHLTSKSFICNVGIPGSIPLEQLIDVVHDALTVFNIAKDKHMIDRGEWHLHTAKMMLTESVSTIDTIKRLFVGRVDGCRVNDLDHTNYNETLINYFILNS